VRQRREKGEGFKWVYIHKNIAITITSLSSVIWHPHEFANGYSLKQKKSFACGGLSSRVNLSTSSINLWWRHLGGPTKYFVPRAHRLIRPWAAGLNGDGPGLYKSLITGRANIVTRPTSWRAWSGRAEKKRPVLSSISGLGVVHYVTLYSDVLHSLADRPENIIYNLWDCETNMTDLLF
jgi:hypothetical protein